MYELQFMRTFFDGLVVSLIRFLQSKNKSVIVWYARGSKI